MTRKEKVDLLLSKVAEDRKEDFIADFRKAGSKEERKAVLKKYGASLTKEEAEAFCKNTGNSIPDEELDNAAGGCCSSSCNTKCGCDAGCY